jgi:poly(hydroxyalkanoate) granule-associated protein
MTDKEIPQEEPVEERSPIAEFARRALLASVGAVAMAQEEAEAFIHKLIERGEMAEQDGKKLIKDLGDKRKKKTEETEGELEKRVENLLGKMNVPTKDDIEALSEKIVTLTKKVEELKKSQS